MKSKFISKTGAHRLILIYAGWAMDDKPFSDLIRPGYDVAVIWDYREISLDWDFIRSYREVCVVAWSLGVYAASLTFTAFEHALTRRIAVNGTCFPVDSLLGIPPSVFMGTRQNLDERNLRKFYRRVCGSSSSYNVFIERAPVRQLDELAEELDVFLNNFVLGSGRQMNWDFAIISTEDAIFPPVNQWRAWHGTPVRMIEGSHLPDFQKIIDRYVIDKDRMTSRFERGFVSYDSQADVQARVVDRVERLLGGEMSQRLGGRGARVLEIGSGTGTLSRVLDNICGESTHFEMWDIAGDAPLSRPNREFRNVDAEMEIMRLPSKSLDCLVSASTVQWFNSAVRFMEECKRVVNSGGYILLTSFVRGNLANVSMATGRALPLLSPSEWKKIIPDGLELLHLQTYKDELEFDSAVDVFRHLKMTGVDSLGRSSAKSSTLAAIRHFEPSLDGKFRITYKPIIILLKKI